MSSPHIALAAGNRPAGAAAQAICHHGGNAVDAGLAAAITAWVAEPFMASIGGSGFIAVRAPAGEVEVFDGNNTMPLTVPEEPGQGLRRIFVENYANGLWTGIGGGSVGVPGILAAIRLAWERHGKIEWPALFEHPIRLAKEGIAFPGTSAYYLSATYREIWSVYESSRDLLARDGELLKEGDTLIQNELAESLEAVAEQGPDVFYRGELGKQIVQEIEADGGFLTMADLESYEAKARTPVSAESFGWRIDSNPPPAVGGAVLTHMLSMLEDANLDDPLERMNAIVGAERAAVGYRNDHYQDPGEIASALQDALAAARERGQTSSSTTHMSAADSDGYVCSLTESNGYSSGMIVRGMFLNNTLGEEELNPRGVHGLPPGSRCHSNMCPTIASGPDVTVGLGSPGADRIVGAVAQTFLALAVDGLDLKEAVESPRVHLQIKPDGELLCFEPGLPGEDLGYPTRPYDDLHMFFGAVQAAAVRADGTVVAQHDRRRSGGTFVV